MAGVKRCRNDGKDKAEETQESSGKASHGDGTVEEGTHPTEEESPERAETLVQIDVWTASFGKSATQFCVTESAEENDDAAENPRNENERSRADSAGHIACDEKNSGTYGVADDDGGGGPEAETADEVRAIGVLGQVVAALVGCER